MQQLYTTLHRALGGIIVSMGGVCFSYNGISRMLKSATQFRNWIPVSKLVCNFAISNLRSAISKLRKFANCAEHMHGEANCLDNGGCNEHGIQVSGLCDRLLDSILDVRNGA